MGSAAARLRHSVSHQRAAAPLRGRTAAGEAALRDGRRHVVFRPPRSARHSGVPEAAAKPGDEVSLRGSSIRLPAASAAPCNLWSTRRSARKTQGDTLGEAVKLPVLQLTAAEAVRKVERALGAHLGRLRASRWPRWLRRCSTRSTIGSKSTGNPWTRSTRSAGGSGSGSGQRLPRRELRVKKPTLSGFMHAITLAAREDDRDQDRHRQRNAVTPLTLHSAKGLEFPQVYLVGIERTCRRTALASMPTAPPSTRSGACATSGSRGRRNG